MWIAFRRSGCRLWRGVIALGLILLVWLLVSLMVAYRLTHRPRARFEESSTHIAWGPLEDHRIKTSDGEELRRWFIDGRVGSPTALLVLHGNRGSRINNKVWDGARSLHPLAAPC